MKSNLIARMEMFVELVQTAEAIVKSEVSDETQYLLLRDEIYATMANSYLPKGVDFELGTTYATKVLYFMDLVRHARYETQTIIDAYYKEVCGEEDDER